MSGPVDASGGGVGRAVLGAELPEGVRFVGGERAAYEGPAWPIPDDPPARDDIADCVACGLCLPHCPTYRLTLDESASPRGRIAAMRSVQEGRTPADETFVAAMDLCLACRACEEACPSNVPFGRMMERARAQIEPQRSLGRRTTKRVLLDFALPRRWVLLLGAALAPLARPFTSPSTRRLLSQIGVRGNLRRLPRTTRAQGPRRGTVALLTGCAQDAWLRRVNLATIRVLSRNGWDVVVPRGQTCCGALQAHHGNLKTARRLARRNVDAFAEAEWVVVNSAGCSAHMREYPDLSLDALGGVRSPGPEAISGLSSRVRDLMIFLDEHGVASATTDLAASVGRIAYHDACHASHAQGIRMQPRRVLAAAIPGIEIVDVPDGETCCGAGGMYNVLEPEAADVFGRDKAEAVASTGATIVCSSNPGCTMQIAAHLREQGAAIDVLHPVELIDRAYRGV
jgi:glycolate oxidase iron-sulfur subunit